MKKKQNVNYIFKAKSTSNIYNIRSTFLDENTSI